MLSLATAFFNEGGNYSLMRNYIHKELSVSTNAELKESVYSASSPVFDVIYADRQSSGRGRLGRSFYSPEGGLYFSAAYPIEKNCKNTAFLTLLSGLAVSSAIKELTGEETEIKWPNDIYIKGKKLCGILAELVISDFGLTAIVGIGINLSVKKEEIPAELKDKMTSLAAENIILPEKTALMKRTVEILDYYVYYCNYLDFTDKKIIDELNCRSFLKNRKVSYDGKDGICGDINADGSICIYFGTKPENIFFGEITF